MQVKIEMSRQKNYFYSKSKDRHLKINNKVLILLLTSTNKLMAEWKEPFEVTELISPVDHKVRLNRQTSKIYHIYI